MDTQRSLTAINELITDYDYLQNTLLSEEPSVAQNMMRHLTKMLVLSCASYYENAVVDNVKKYAQKHAKKYKLNPHGFDTISKRSFFQLFDFGREKPNKTKAFLGPLDYFGRAFRDSLIEEITASDDIQAHMNAFQEVCRLRNSMAHNDLITADDAILNKSFSEIIALHKNAVEFLDYLNAKIT